jgi:uncharacterized protein YfeS
MKPPLDFYVMIRTYHVYGGHRTLSLIGDFLLVDAPAFGAAVRDLTITFHFSTPGPPKYSLDDAFKNFHANLLKLPKVVFRRNREKMDIQVASDLVDGHEFERFRGLSLSLFKRGVAETVSAIHLMAPKLTSNDDFDVDALINHCERRQQRIPENVEALEALEVELKQKKAAARAAMSPWERLGIDWRDYHPDAPRILDDPFFWRGADDFAPHGNDTGADLLSDYKDWIAAEGGGDPLEFFTSLVKRWGFPKGADDPIFQTAFDEAAVALAFAELKLKARCDPRVASLAMEAIGRQRGRALSANGTEQLERLDLIESKLARPS